MRPDYKNWMPKGMIYGFLCAALGCCAAAIVLSLLLSGALKTALTMVFALLFGLVRMAGMRLIGEREITNALETGWISAGNFRMMGGRLLMVRKAQS